MMSKCGMSVEMLSSWCEFSCLHHLIPQQTEFTPGMAHPVSEKAAAEFRRIIQAWEHRMLDFAKSWGKEKGKNFPVV